MITTQFASERACPFPFDTTPPTEKGKLNKKAVKAALALRGMTQFDLAKKFNRSRATINACINQGTSAELAADIAKFLNLPC